MLILRDKEPEVLTDKMKPWARLKSICSAAVSIMARKKRTANFEQYTVLDVGADGTKSYTHYLGPPQCDIVRHTEYVSGGNKVTARTSFYSTPTTDAGGQSMPSFDLSELCGPAGSEVANEDVDLFDLDAEYLEDMEKLSGQTPHRRGAGDHPLREWVPEIDNYLAEMLHLEGRCGFNSGRCKFCEEGPAMIHCQDCFEIAIYCRTCAVNFHRLNPFHRMQRWCGSHFQPVSLKDLGLRIQLGHHAGQPCRLPVQATGDDFLILDVTGIHAVGLDFCGCETAEVHTVQLLRTRLFPATSTNPKTAATFGLCRYAHLLTTQSKTSGYEFYQSLAQLTDNTSVQTPKDRYPAFMRIMRMWRHLKMLKRAGRGHDPGGVRATKPGACAVLCPACPHPGKNLPPDWEEAPEDQRWLYRLFIRLDANFHLKRKKVSSDTIDPGLNHGYAYFVEEKTYKDYLTTYNSLVTEESSTCNNHDAVKLANMKGSVAGTVASGVDAVTCTRHDMRLPCSVGDLQKGECYVNMDYMFFSTLGIDAPHDVIISYNIACQWSKNLRKRHLIYESCLFQMEDHEFIFLVLKFHIHTHQQSCQDSYSFHKTPHVAETDGKGVERPWSDSNMYSSSTKEMGPGLWRDFLDDAFADYNWRKICGMPTLFLRRMKAVLPECNDQVFAFAELNNAMAQEDRDVWRAALETWEKDPSKPNPFVVTHPTITQAAVHLQLANEEAAELEKGKQCGMLHELVWTGHSRPRSTLHRSPMGQDHRAAQWSLSQDRGLGGDPAAVYA
ncbi:hypothetical protein SCP_0503150 [Sparassis crispa]|uniref:CxC2-like cysteine cluster KDZ transposase-associated domain-containing protein n=1 Tax=Sparassis crispa TaxID=139825 RepID=A0A401GM35_9APHY|nr:hypothetical protein SCP_0503150 [Sparassis crispa]GBE83267.1 hypothetical protein SCP_0503150 [Sparassis crispa]